MELRWFLIRFSLFVFIWVSLALMGNPTFKSFVVSFIIVGGSIILQILFLIISGHIKDYMNKKNKTRE